MCLPFPWRTHSDYGSVERILCQYSNQCTIRLPFRPLTDHFLTIPSLAFAFFRSKTTLMNSTSSLNYQHFRQRKPLLSFLYETFSLFCFSHHLLFVLLSIRLGLFTLTDHFLSESWRLRFMWRHV